MRDLSTDTIKDIQASETGACFLWLLEMEDSSSPQIITEKMYVVNNNENITSNGIEYSAVAFKMSAPSEEDGTIGDTSLTIGNVDRVLTEYVRRISAPLKVTAKLIRSDAPDDTEGSPYTFYLKNVTYTSLQITGTLAYLTNMSDNVSTVKFSTTLFPGLYG